MFITDKYSELLGSYSVLDESLAYQDLKFYLEKKRETAIKKLRKADDPIARATWQIVDEFFNRKELLIQEVKIKDQEKNK